MICFEKGAASFGFVIPSAARNPYPLHHRSPYIARDRVPGHSIIPPALRPRFCRRLDQRLELPRPGRHPLPLLRGRHPHLTRRREAAEQRRHRPRQSRPPRLLSTRTHRLSRPPLRSHRCALGTRNHRPSLPQQRPRHQNRRSHAANSRRQSQPRVGELRPVTARAESYAISVADRRI